MRKLLAPTVIVVSLGIFSAALAQENVPQPRQPAQPQTGQSATAGAADAYSQQVSYALGRNFAQNLSGAGIECDFQSLVSGIQDVLTGAQPKWSDEQLQSVMQRFEGEMQQKMAARMQQVGAKNEQEAAAFLAQNAKREGVQTTPSGLQYRVLRQGNGPSPTRTDTVRCNYRGVFINGTEFDSSTRQGGPAEFAVGEVIPGWTEALQKMHVGDKWQLFVPPKLAYGPEGRPGAIEPNSLLVFEIELLEILPQ